MCRNLFPFEITKRISLFGSLIIIVPVLVITLVTQLQYYYSEVNEKTNTLYSVARVLDKEIDKDFSTILKEKKADNKSTREQVLILNQALQSKIDRLLTAYPEIGMGYYSKELNSRVAFGPNFNINSLTPLPKDSPRLKVYQDGRPFLHKTVSSSMWNGQSVLSLIYPIYRNGKIIGHVFANARLTHFYVLIFKDIIIVFLIGISVVILTLTLSWSFLKKLKVELELFAGAVIRGDSRDVHRILPELTPIIDHVGKHTRELELLVKQLVTEITKREKVEEELIEANEKITSIVESVTDAFFALDKDWHITYINLAAEQQISAKRDDVIGKALWEVFPDGDTFTDCLTTAFSVQQSGHIQIYAKSIGKWFEITSYSSKESLGVYFRDITERKNAEERIRFQANLLNHVRNAVFTTDLEGKVTYCNSFAETLYGWKTNEFVGRNIDEFMVIPEGLGMSDRVVRAYLTTKGYWEGDIEVVTKGGVVVPIHRIVTLIKNPEGISTGIISVGIDLTERKKLEKELVRLDRLHMVGEMAAGIGHEVRNPMTTVRGFMQLLAAKEENSLKQEKYKLMIEELDRANSIITEYLSLAKNKKVELKPQSLNSLIRNILPLLLADAMVSDKYIQTELENIPDLLLDEKEITQLLLNLVRNGLEAMKPGGTVILKTYMDAGFVLLAVKDEGSGIDPQIMDSLGTPFVTTKETGTGLGLAVSYSIVGRHNAAIDIESTPEGTTFFVKFRDTVSVSQEAYLNNAV